MRSRLGPVPGYALIVEQEAGRAARYQRVVEDAGAVAQVVSRPEQALAHVRKAGPPAIVLLDHVVPQEAGLPLLRALRELVAPGEAPAVVIADSRETYQLAESQRADLNVAAVLTRWHPLSAVESAVRAALTREGAPDEPPREIALAGPARSGEEAPRRDGAVAGFLPPHLPPEPEPDTHLDALDLAERLADHPLVERLARLRVPAGDTAEDLQRLVADTAEAFEAPMALLWLERGGRLRFAAHPRPAADASLRRGGGHWTALRDAFGETPLHVEDTAGHVFLAGNPLVVSGRIRCAAGAPLPGHGEHSIGTIALAAPAVGAIPRSVLDPLMFWAHRVVSELPPAPGAPDRGRERRRGERPSRPPPAAGDLTDALGVGVMVSDARGTLTFANAAVPELLELGGRKLVGMRRTAVMSSLRACGAPEDVLGEISRAEGPEPRRLTVPLRRGGARRILRWQTRAIRVDGKEGRLDEIVDVTSEGEEIEAHEDLVRIDAVTGLANRRAGEEALAREIAAALRGGAALSVALFEVDVPDPGAAERAFREVAWLLRDALRGYDLVARFAPRRLLAVLPQARGPQAAALAERFRGVLAKTAKRVAGAVVSFGVAQFEPDHDVGRLLSLAAAALDAAVAKGRRLSGREDA